MDSKLKAVLPMAELSNVEAVSSVDRAQKPVALDGLVALQDDFLPHAEASLADVVLRGKAISTRLREQCELAGGNRLQDVVLSVEGLLMQLIGLQLKCLALRAEAQGMAVDTQEAI